LAFIFIITSTSASASWSLKREYGNTAIYSSQNHTLLTINHKTTVPKIKKFSKKLINKLANDKKKMLDFIGVTDWKVTNSNLERSKEITIITIEGSYRDNQGEVNYFIEKHFYSSASKLQILLTNSDLNKINKDATDSHMQGFRIKYGF